MAGNSAGCAALLATAGAAPTVIGGPAVSHGRVRTPGVEVGAARSHHACDAKQTARTRESRAKRSASFSRGACAARFVGVRRRRVGATANQGLTRFANTKPNRGWARLARERCDAEQTQSDRAGRFRHPTRSAVPHSGQHACIDNEPNRSGCRRHRCESGRNLRLNLWIQFAGKVVAGPVSSGRWG